MLEEGEAVDKIYGSSFLPYSGNTDISEDVFYLARGTRINLVDYKESTNDRRLNKKIEHLGLTLKYLDKKDFNIFDEKFVDFILKFQNERFANGEMTKERLVYILNKPFFNKILVIFSEELEKELGYVFVCEGDNCLHYWFCFYDTDYFELSLGKWIMYQTIVLAKELGKQYLYLGTSYTKNSLYKGDFNGFEFWDGVNWNKDKKLLAYLIENTHSENTLDNYKKRTDLQLINIFNFDATI